MQDIIMFFSPVINSSYWLLFVSSFCSMPFTQADQEFVGATDTTVNNTGEDIMGVQARIPFLSQITRGL